MYWEFTWLIFLKINSYKTYAILIAKYFWNGSSLGHKYIFLTITYNFFPPCSLFRFDVLIKWNTERNFLNVIWLFFFHADAKKEKGNYFQLKCVLILKGKEKRKRNKVQKEGKIHGTMWKEFKEQKISPQN